MAPSSFFFEQAAEQGMLPVMIISKLIRDCARDTPEKKDHLKSGPEACSNYEF